VGNWKAEGMLVEKKGVVQMGRVLDLMVDLQWLLALSALTFEERMSQGLRRIVVIGLHGPLAHPLVVLAVDWHKRWVRN
jgi:hypothetical protein